MHWGTKWSPKMGEEEGERLRAGQQPRSRAEPADQYPLMASNLWGDSFLLDGGNILLRKPLEMSSTL